MSQKKKLVLSEILRALAEQYVDKVSLLMKTEFRDAPQDVRFLLSFDHAIGDAFRGDIRYEVKQAVGSLLGKRRKTSHHTKQRDSVFPHTTMPTLSFVVMKAECGEVILGTQVMGETMSYRRNASGEVINTAFTNHLRHIAGNCGLKKAQEVFAELDRSAASKTLVVFGERSDDLATMTLLGKWKMLVCRGVRGAIIAQVSEIGSGRPVKQKDLPALLIREARAIARAYFKDARTADLFA